MSDRHYQLYRFTTGAKACADSPHFMPYSPTFNVSVYAKSREDALSRLNNMKIREIKQFRTRLGEYNHVDAAHRRCRHLAIEFAIEDPHVHECWCFIVINLPDVGESEPIKITAKDYSTIEKRLDAYEEMEAMKALAGEKQE